MALSFVVTKDSNDAAEGLLSTGVKNFEVPGAMGQVSTLNEIELVVGGFYFDPALYTGTTINFRFIGDINTSDTGGSGQLRLYDTGAGVGFFAPVLRATRTITYANVGQRISVTAPLALAASPGVNVNQIHDVARTYELRLYLDTAATSSSVSVAWGGLVATKLLG